MIRIPKKYAGVARFYLIILNTILCAVGAASLYYIIREHARHQTHTYRVGLFYVGKSPFADAAIAQQKAILSESPHTFECVEFDGQSNPLTLKSMIESALSQSPRFDVLCPIGITATELMKEARAKRGLKTPVFFQCMESTLWKTWAAADSTLSKEFVGVVGGADWARRVSLILRLKPEIRHVTITSGLGSADQSIVEGLTDELRSRNISYTLIEAETAQQIRERLNGELLTHTDLIWPMRDDVCSRAMDLIVKRANEFHIPVFASDEEAAQRGAAYTLAPQEGVSGSIVGKMIRTHFEEDLGLDKLQTVDLEDCGTTFYINDETLLAQHPTVDMSIIDLVKGDAVFVNREEFVKEIAA